MKKIIFSDAKYALRRNKRVDKLTSKRVNKLTSKRVTALYTLFTRLLVNSFTCLLVYSRIKYISHRLTTTGLRNFFTSPSIL
jgi:hypothetical protein